VLRQRRHGMVRREATHSFSISSLRRLTHGTLSPFCCTAVRLTRLSSRAIAQSNQSFANSPPFFIIIQTHQHDHPDCYARDGRALSARRASVRLRSTACQGRARKLLYLFLICAKRLAGLVCTILLVDHCESQQSQLEKDIPSAASANLQKLVTCPPPKESAQSCTSGRYTMDSS
jgi:hypothetical protein